MPHKKAVDVLVTGASGFLGGGIVKGIAREHPDWNICGLDLKNPSPEITKLLRQFIQADIVSSASVTNAFVDYTPDIVIHTAGIVPARKDRYSTSKKQWEKVKAINYHGTKHVLDAAMASGCKRFVYTSSVTVVIDHMAHDYYYMSESAPTGLATLHYGKSKGMAEEYVLDPKHREKGLVACALRPSPIIGPDDTATIGLMYDLIAKGETNFVVGDGNNLYDFMYIDNAVDAHILAAENLLTTKTASGQAFFISNQEPVYFWDFMAYVWAQFGHVPKYKIHIPMMLAYVVAWLLEIITWITGSAATLDRGSVQDGVKSHFSNNDKAIRYLGYRPKVGLAEGVRLSCEGYKKHLLQQDALLKEPKKLK